MELSGKINRSRGSGKRAKEQGRKKIDTDMDKTLFVLTFPEPAPENENDIIFQITRQDLMHICLAVA